MRKKGHKNSFFRESILQASKINLSKIVLALDLDGAPPSKLLRTGEQLLDKTAPYLCGAKLGRQTVLNLGTERTRALIKQAHGTDLPCIIDDKLNDIDETNTAISQAYFRLGFDGIIVNPFAGWKGGLQTVFKIANQSGKGVIVLVYMSHPGASEGFGQLVLNNHHKKPRPQYEVFAERAERWNADGAVVGATRPDIVRKVRTTLGTGIPIYSPGIGAQGGRIPQASKAGTDFFIIGRAIARASNPEEIAQDYARQSMEDAA